MKAFLDPEFLFLSIPVVFVLLFITGAGRVVWKQFKQLADAEGWGGGGVGHWWDHCRSHKYRILGCAAK